MGHAVTTLRVVWIEIPRRIWWPWIWLSHHLAGGVDWNSYLDTLSKQERKSPPCGWCGLKSIHFRRPGMAPSHHLAGGVDWNFSPRIYNHHWTKSPPCGWCGLKSQEQLSYYTVPGHHLAGGVLRGNILLRLGYLCKSPKYIAITFFVGNTMGEFIEKSMIWDREHDKYIMNT